LLQVRRVELPSAITSGDPYYRQFHTTVDRQ
jgi:hypothetical protein